MRVRHRAGGLLQATGRRLPAGLRGSIGRASRRVRRGYRTPLVTVVLDVSDEQTTRIGPALDSLRAQTHRNLDIVVVPYGRHQAVLRDAERHAAEDWRVRVARRPLRDRSAARDWGAAQARGSYLLFMAGCDEVLPETVADLLHSLTATGSDFAAGRLAPAPVVGPRLVSPSGAAHEEHRPATDLERSPQAITDLALGNRLFRRSFWTGAGLAFAATDGRDSTMALAAFRAARSFDLLTRPGYVPVNRADGVPVGTVTDVFADLEEWLDEQRANARAVEALELPDAQEWWQWGVLDSAIQPLLADVERATGEQWRRLREYAEQVLSGTGEHAWEMLRAESRLRLWLLRDDRRAELEESVAARWFEQDNRPTHVDAGKVYAHLPFFGDDAVGVPRDVYRMHEAETPLRVVLREVRWSAPTTLSLRLLVYVDHVGYGDATPEVEVRLTGPDGESLPVPVEHRPDPDANFHVGHRYQDYSRGVVTAHVDAAQLAARFPGNGAETSSAWRPEVTWSFAGMTRRGGITSRDPRGSAGTVETPHLAPRLVDGLRVGLCGQRPDELAVVVRPDAGVRLVEAGVDGRRVTGILDVGDGDLAAVRATLPGGPSARTALGGTGALRSFTLTVPDSRPDQATGQWDLVAVARDGSVSPVAWPDTDEGWLAVGQGEVVLSRTTEGGTAVSEAADTLVLTGTRLVDGDVVAEGHWLGRAPRHYAFALEGDRVTLEGRAETLPDGTVRVQFRTEWDEWGLGTTRVPPGRYAYTLRCGPGHDRVGRVLVGPQVLDALLEFDLDRHYRCRVFRIGWEAAVNLMPPLADDERGPFYQQCLRSYLDRQDPVDDGAVYLQSYTGQSATDSQLALHHELRRARPDLRLYWGIADRSSAVPEGGHPVVMYTREWYDVISSAKYLVMNIDFDRWFRRRRGQKVLQSFHGYPAKAMGVMLWEAKRFTPRRIQAELARTRDDWDLILTPAPEMDVHYRVQYRYDGAIHNQGYPRDDLLASPDAERVRKETRERLGIGPDQTAVLYAPTWRDDLATSYRSAQLVEHLDLEAASRALGPEYVILMRGHRFHARAGARGPRAARLLDVTHYPEINHLILAADAAVLDYSSLRFDFALTGRPMLFLVPDLDSYTGGVRGFLYDFRESAPGPLLETADQVVERLRDLPRVRHEFADDYDRFNRRFNYLMDGHAAERVVRAFFS